MPRVRFTLPQVKDYPDTRPQGCPHCGSVFLHRHGEVTKPIRDLYVLCRPARLSDIGAMTH